MSERVLLQLNENVRLAVSSEHGTPYYQEYAGYDSWIPLPAHCQGPRVGRIELSHLAARVRELEAENAKLRKCVEAGDSEIEAWREWGARIGGDERVCGWVHQENYGLYCLLSDPPVSNIPYDLTRAEVDNG